MSKHIVVLVLALLVLCITPFAQAPEPPKPGPEHKALNFFAGRWTSEGEMKPGMLGPGGKASGSDTCEWFTGGFQMVCRGEGKSPLGTMSSLGVMTYNRNERIYTYYGIDSMGSSELSKGNKSGNTWSFTSTSNMAGKSFESRYTIVETGPDSYTFKWEVSPDATKWATLFEGKATRADKPTSR